MSMNPSKLSPITVSLGDVVSASRLVCADRGIEMERRTPYAELIRMQGVTQALATEDQLTERITYVSAWIEAIRSGREANRDG